MGMGVVNPRGLLSFYLLGSSAACDHDLLKSLSCSYRLALLLGKHCKSSLGQLLTMCSAETWGPSRKLFQVALSV